MADDAFVKRTLKDMLEPRHGRAKRSVSQVAAAMGLKHGTSTLYGYMNARDLPARLVPAITRATGNTSLIEDLADHCGGVFTPRVKGRSRNDVIASMAKEMSGAVAEVAADMADGRITDAELKRIHKEITEARAALVAAEAECVALYEAGRGGRRRTLGETKEGG